jgi:hypothetical protein
VSDKTIGEIQQEYSTRAAEILSRYHDALDEIKEDREPETGAYLDRLSDAQRNELLMEQKGTRVDQERARTIDEYTEHLESYHSELQSRAQWLHERLYKVENTTALANAAAAEEEALGTMLNIAAQAGDKDLARAVFVAADSRGLGEVVACYFDEVDPDARTLYNEWRQVPPREVLERQVSGVEQIIHRPSVDSLMPSPRVGTY